MSGDITDVGIAHAEVISVLHGACFETPWDNRSISEILAMPGAGALIIGTGDQPQGFALFRLAADEAEIISIGVSPKARRCGQAGRLLRAITGRASKQGAVKIFLEVGEDNLAARGLYEKGGFKIVGRRKGYYNHAAEKSDALIYALEITAK
jgi:[ribosomal protein S18]-alanine N-acetyltransferase